MEFVRFDINFTEVIPTDKIGKESVDRLQWLKTYLVLYTQKLLLSR